MLARIPLARRARPAVVGYLRERLVVYLFLATVFGLGLAAGALGAAAVDPEAQSELDQFLDGFLRSLSEGGGSPAELLERALVADVLKTAGATWLLGLSLIGAPLVLVLLFLRGFVLGFTAAFLVGRMALPGALFAAAALVPHNLLAVPGAFLAAGAAIGFAGAGARILAGRRGAGTVYGKLATFTCLILISSLFFAAAALVEAYVTPILARSIVGLLLG